MKEFLSNLWKTQPNTVLGGGAAIILLGGFSGLYFLANYDSSSVQEVKVIPYKESTKTSMSDIEYMKSCARQVRVDRVNWYLDEIGIKDNFERIKVLENTDLFMSSKPYELMEEYKAKGIKPNSGKDLPYKDCSPSARYK